VEISDNLLCLFNAEVTRDGDDYVVRIPRREVEQGAVDPGDVYRVALLSRPERDGGDGGTGSTSSTTGSTNSASTGSPSEPQPPVEEGEIRYVEIEDLGKQGDGIARVERGYVIIVPGAEVGERVKVEISQVKSNFAVGEIIEESF
jgi:predicted RNA-binding protein with TRAM domain